MPKGMGYGYKKAKGSKGISNPKADPPKNRQSPKSYGFAGVADSRPGANDNKQSAR